MGEDQFDYCFRAVREADRDRYLTLLFAAPAERGYLAALAAFNLELVRAREQTSESLLALVRLQWWREAIEEIGGGGKVRAHPVATALADATRARGLDTDLMLGMIAVREAELEDGPPESQAVFAARADATAGNLLRLSLQAMRLDPRDPALAEAAQRVGRAYATAGLARSVPGDARRRLVRLPLDRLAAAQVDLDRLYELKPQKALADCLRDLAAIAESDLAAAQATRPPRAARPLLLTARLARLHLERLRRAAYDPFDMRLARAHPMDVWRLLRTNLTGGF